MKLFLKQMLLISCLFAFGCKASNMRKDEATSTIDKLQNGMLLVKLKTSENKINRYKEMGDLAKANEAIKEQQTLNANIISAFTKKFDFCPVYFFHTNDIANIKNNDFEGSIFKNIGEDLKSHPASDTYYLIAELDVSYQDELFAKSGEETKKVAGIGAVTALVIRDQQNFQISEPFPYQVRVIDNNKENLNRSVTKLNKRLKEFDNKMERRKLKKKLRQ